MFLTRCISGAVLLIIALVTIIAGGGVLAAVLLLTSIAGFFELSKALGIHKEGTKINGLELSAVIWIIVYYLEIFFLKSDIYTIMTLILGFMALLFVYVVRFPGFNSNQVVAAFFAVMYAPVMLSFIYQTRELDQGIYIVWLIFISSWVSDTCAYLVGMAFGKTIGNHKAFPVLSPKKSVEGCIGGVLGAAGIGALYGYFMVESAFAEQEITWVFALIGAIGSIFSQMGDLAASAIKRNGNIKDYGKLIPGHGGIMDRFDSVIVTAPMIYFLARLLLIQ